MRPSHSRLSPGVVVRRRREVLEQEEERDEDRDLEEDGQARRGGVDAVLLVELHQLLVHLLAVALVLALDLLHLGRMPLEVLHGVDLLDRQRHEQHAHHHRQRDDGPGPRETDRAVRPEEVDDVGEDVDDRRRDAGDDHGWSTPPWLHGLQRRRRHAVFAEPLIGPCLRKRSCRVLGAASGGTCRSARPPRPVKGRASAAPCSAPSCGHLAQQLVHVLTEPAGSLGIRGLDEAGPHHEHVVATRRDVARAGFARAHAAFASCGCVERRCRCPSARRARGGLVVRLLARKPVEDEVARRRRAALAVDGIEVLRTA